MVKNGKYVEEGLQKWLGKETRWSSRRKRVKSPHKGDNNRAWNKQTEKKVSWLNLSSLIVSNLIFLFHLLFFSRVSKQRRRIPFFLIIFFQFSKHKVSCNVTFSSSQTMILFFSCSSIAIFIIVQVSPSLAHLKYEPNLIKSCRADRSRKATQLHKHLVAIRECNSFFYFYFLPSRLIRGRELNRVWIEK